MRLTLIDLRSGAHTLGEADVGHHLWVEHWEADMERGRKIVRGRRVILRASNWGVRNEQVGLAADLFAVGVPTA